MNQDALVAALAQLSPQERESVRARASLMASGSPEETKDTQAADPLVFEALKRVLDTYGCEVPRLHQILNGKLAKLFKNGAAVLVTFVDRHFQPKSKIERSAIIQKLVYFLAEAVDNSYGNIPVTPKTMCQAMARVADEVDAAFPGYRQNGLLKAVFKAPTAPDRLGA